MRLNPHTSDASAFRVYVHPFDQLLDRGFTVLACSTAPQRRANGWLLGVLFNPSHNRHGMALLDAAHVEDGPVAEAWLEYGFPPGFHRTFAAA